ncbi:MAG: sigma 54-interacting transcriptional regulator [Spirochaetota bacterium]
MFWVALFDGNNSRYRDLVLTGRLHITRFSNWLQFKLSLSDNRVQAAIINARELPFDEKQLYRELETSGILIVVLGHRCRLAESSSVLYLHDSLSAEEIVRRMVQRLLENTLNLDRLTCTDTHKTDWHKIPLIGSSPAMQRVRSHIITYAQSRSAVLIVGETGTGKNLAAKALHALSKRTGPYQAINCCAFAKDLFESELFGHARGAFTGAIRDKTGMYEQADKGTLFLDEIGDLPLALQPKLLKVVEEQTFSRVGETTSRRADVRIVSATNKHLISLIQTNQFREDLLYRISTFSLVLPPLRERPEDIRQLADSFLQSGAPGTVLSEDTLHRLYEKRWPGNVRQLFTFLSRCLAHFPGREIIHLSGKLFEELYEAFPDRLSVEGGIQ